MIGTLRLRSLGFGMLSAGLFSACLSGGTKVTAIATAKEISSSSDLIGGPNASGEVGDFLLKNERIRVVIQRAGAPARAPFSYGGNLIDLDRIRFPGDKGNDRFGGQTVLINGVRTVKADRVFVLEDGSATGYAVIRAEGDDAPYQGVTLPQFAEAASVPVAGNDVEQSLDLLVKTDYILRPGANYVEVRTTFLNRRSAATKVVIGDTLDHGSTTPFVSGGKGFALPGADEGWGVASKTVVFEAEGISYGYHLGRQQVIQAVDNRAKSRFTDTGVWIPQNGLLGVFFNFATLDGAVNPVDAEEDNLLTVPGAGSASFSRFLVVGNGDAGEIFEGVNLAHDRDSEYVQGQVMTTNTEGQTVPAAGADVAVFSGGVPFAHLKADANGQYRGALPPGDYELAVNLKGHPYDGGSPELKPLSLGRKLNRTQSVDFTVPTSGLLRLFVKDMTLVAFEDGSFEPQEGPIPAHIVIERESEDPSPAAYESGKATYYPFRPAESNLITVDASGEGALALEPGKYKISGFHGGAFSMDRAEAEIRAGKRTDRVMELARVVPAEGSLIADFSGATDRSSGALSPADRVVQAFAEGIELFVAPDNGVRTPLLDAAFELDSLFATSAQDPTPITRQIGVSEGERIVSSGYGSFSAWPLYAAEGKPQGGGFQWDNGDQPGFLPSQIAEELSKLAGDGTYLSDVERDTAPVPIITVDQPFAPPGSTLPGYFDALDLHIDWSKKPSEGGVFVGPKAVEPAKVGLSQKTREDLWTNLWRGLNVYSSTDEQTLWLGMNSWFAFLNLSLNGDKKSVPQIVAIGGLTGQGRPTLPGGGPRNLVRTSIEQVKQFRPEARGGTQAEAISEVNQALGFAKNVVTNGPALDFQLSLTDGTKVTRIGEMVDTFGEDEIAFSVMVTAPCWASIDRIDIYSNTKVVEPKVVNQEVVTSLQPVTTFTTFTSRKVIDDRTGLPEVTPGEACRADGTGAGRVEIVLESALPLDGDAWFVALASGSSPMPYSVRPIAFSNPVYVDADGNGTLGPICPGAACPNSGKTRLGWYETGRAAEFWTTE
jgi:hypothetical protein